jgi:protein-S-isoprenylcysteine O-methyltransferase Ste14
MSDIAIPSQVRRQRTDRLFILYGPVLFLVLLFVFGFLIDRTGSWTLPFAGSIGLLLLGAGMAFRIHPDRPFEPAVAEPIAA